MAHHGAGSQKSDRVHLTRRELIRRLALSATVASLGRTADAAQSLSAESPASTKVRKVLESLVRDTPEIGLQVAAYLDGKLVVDAWAGLADQATKRPVDGDTLFMLSSTTKGVTATCMHLLVEQHKLDYDMPIVKVWPEFGVHGKQAATLRHALAHRTGVPQTPVGYTPDWLADWDRMCGGSFGYADPARRLGIGFAKNYFTYTTGGAVNQGRPVRAASNVVAEAVFDALGLKR